MNECLTIPIRKSISSESKQFGDSSIKNLLIMRFEPLLFPTFLCICFVSLIQFSDSQATVEDGDLQALIQKFMTKAEQILQGNDPYNFGGSSLFSNSYGTYYNGSVSELIISGVSTMNMTFLNVTQQDPNIYLGMNLTFDNLMVTGNYFLDLDILTLFKLYGSGELGTKAKSCKLNITTAITQEASSNNVLQFTDLAINLELPSFKVDIKNLLNRPAIGTYASAILNDIAPSLLNSDQKLQTLLSSWSKSTLNSMAMKNSITLAFVKEFILKFTG